MKDLSLKSFLDGVQEELKSRDEARREVHEDMRKAIRLSKQAILFSHQERLDDARRSLKDAGELFSKLREVSKKHPEVIHFGLVDAAFEEYAEAHNFLNLITQGRFVDPEELGVHVVPYVLGLGDVVGEFRRRALDFLRKGDVETAEDCLQTMEQIYLDLTAMDDAYLLVPGLRRKCDVARRIIETTRGDVTIEARRQSLERSIRRLENTLEKKGKVRENVGE